MLGYLFILFIYHLSFVIYQFINLSIYQFIIYHLSFINLSFINLSRYYFVIL